jgi:hypothetical protein
MAKKKLINKIFDMLKNQDYMLWARIIFTILGILLTSGYIPAQGQLGQIIGALVTIFANKSFVANKARNIFGRK